MSGEENGHIVAREQSRRELPMFRGLVTGTDIGAGEDKEFRLSRHRVSITCLVSFHMSEFPHKAGGYLRLSDRLAKPKFDDHLTLIEI
jgi:hypothetical protein